MTTFRALQRIIVAFVPVLAVFAFGASPAGAGTLSPWWHLASALRPSYLSPGRQTDEVQRLTVSATVGSYKVGHGGKERTLEVGATPEKVQEVLEELYGSGDVEVTGGPPSEAYEVKFVGGLADRPVGLFTVQSVSLTGGVAEAKEVVKGRFAGLIVVTATNLGDAPVKSCIAVAAGAGKYTSSECTGPPEPGKGEFELSPVMVADELPEGLEAVGIEGTAMEGVTVDLNILACSLESLSCTFTGKEVGGYKALWPYFQLQMRIEVNLKQGSEAAKSGEVNEASITGGGAPAASASSHLTVSEAPVPFGVSAFEMRPEEVGGGIDTQAGSHPFQFTTTIHFNESFEENPQGQQEGQLGRPIALTKDLSFALPPGLIGNPDAVPKCTLGQFVTEVANQNECPADTAIGVARATITVPGLIGRHISQITEPLFNIEPAPGEPARFGFLAYHNPVLLDTAVRTGSDYGVTVNVDNITQAAGFLASEVTFWGVPGDPRHDLQRGWGCLELSYEGGGSICHPQEEVHPPPFLSLPTSCIGPLRSTVEGDSWQQAAQRRAEGLSELYDPLAETTVSSSLGLDGCNRLPFEPSIKDTPDGQAGSTPTGLNVDVHVDQESVLCGSCLAESSVRNITVALPQGVAINPSGGDGLEACSEGLIGFEAGSGKEGEGDGFEQPPLERGVSIPKFFPRLPGSIHALDAGEAASLEPGLNFCTNASKIGEVTIHTPLLPNPLKGFVYLAAQEANPFGSLVAMYIVAEDPVSGTLVKLPGKVVLCQGAGEVIAGMTCQGLGQIVSTFENDPQLPFEDAELHFFGGERAPLASPTRCGAYETKASFAPWSGSEAVGASSTFDIVSGPATTGHPGGTPCPGSSLPFSPSSTGGATNVNAGAFSPLTTTFSTEPGEQNLQSVEAKLPPGLSGLLSSVELCREPQANLGTCGPNSQIGETTVSVGVGGDPFTVKGGKVFITGPYNGTSECTTPGSNGCAPFGLSVVNPAKAGPFDLADTKNNHPVCDCVLVRAKIEINPETAALTVTSDPPGSPDAIPTSIEGIPLEIQHVNITTTRSAFQFNPTNCSKMEFEATLHSAEGGVDTISIPFQVTNCAALKFEPKFTVSTYGKTSRANGASLTADVTYPKVPQGTDADIAKVKVELPKALPSRLTTLQKACTQTQFKANPAGCPPASVIGTAIVHTQLLPVPLTGPAYFVSNGHEAFPNLIMVLQGYGITIDLVGDTFISKAGITSSTFKAVPDQPFENFELNLPNGPYSALAANGNLCKQKLTMPTEFVAQNGAVLDQNTKIAVTGCPKAHKAKKKAKHRKKGKSKHKKGKR